MKKALLLVATILCICQMVKAQNDDPFERMKKDAQARPALVKTGANKIQLHYTDPFYKLDTRPAITYKPFTLIDKNGRAIPADTLVTLPNGNKMTAQEYVDQLNGYEKKLSAMGHSLHNEKRIKISKVVTDKSFLDDKVKLLPRILGPRMTTLERNTYLNPGNKFGDYIFKPLGEMTEANKTFNESLQLSVDSIIVWTKHLPSVHLKDIPGTSKSAYSDLKVASYPYSWVPVDMNMGDKSTVYLGVHLGFTSDLELYSPNLQDVKKNKSFFTAHGIAAVECALFNNEFDVIKAEADINAPADKTKKMSASFDVTIFGDDVVNEKSDDLANSPLSKDYGQNFDEGYGFSIPIWDGINFDGRVGIKGQLGVTCTLGPLIKSADFNMQLAVIPNAQLTGYVQVGVDVLGIVGIGVGGELNVFQGDISISDCVSAINLYTPGTTQLALNNTFEVDYGLTFMSGDMYVYARECVPFISWFTDDACWQQDATIFSWGGITQNGTIAKLSDSKVYDIGYPLSSTENSTTVMLQTAPLDPGKIVRAYTLTPSPALKNVPFGGSGNSVLIVYKGDNGIIQETILGDVVLASGFFSSDYMSWQFKNTEQLSDGNTYQLSQDNSNMVYMEQQATKSDSKITFPPTLTLTKMSVGDAKKMIQTIQTTYLNAVNNEVK